MAQTFFVDDEIASQLRLDGIVNLVDAAHLVQHLDDERPEGVENEAVEQIAFADRIVVNKPDLVDDDHPADVVGGRIRAINAMAQMLPTTHGEGRSRRRSWRSARSTSDRPPNSTRRS